jgi:hypothetical protein
MTIPLINGQKRSAIPPMQISVGLTTNGHVVIERLLHDIDTVRMPVEPENAIGLMKGIGAALEQLRPGCLAAILQQWQREIVGSHVALELTNGITR